MALGDRLKKARENKRYTQMDVAIKLGISNGTLSGYERDYRDPDTDTLKKLADLYEVSPNYLLFGSENKKGTAYTIPENEISRIVREVEEEYKVSLQDDPEAMNMLRNLIESLARMKKK